MGDFNRRGSSGPRRSFGDRGSFGRGNEERQSFKAVCADCGRDCDVPFEPRNGRPVYCRDCFKNHAPEDSGTSRYPSRDSRGGDSRGDSRRGGDRPMFSAVCDNCGKTCQLPFEPRAGKPVFCSRCFEDKEKGTMTPRGNGAPTSTPSASNNQLDAINTKLDKILNLLTNTKATKKVENTDQDQSELPKTTFASAVAAENIEQNLNKTKAEVAKVSKPKKKAVKKIHVDAPVELPIETPTETPVE